MNGQWRGEYPNDRPPTGFTGPTKGRSIVTVSSGTQQLLTKRRAVDFCRVATALCPSA